MSNTYCQFERGESGWQCNRCGFAMRPSDTPPRRLCLPATNKLAQTFKPVRSELRYETQHAAVCRHRGEQTRTVRCGLCGAREVEVPVFECRELGECTLRPARPRGERGKLACCVGCVKYEPLPSLDRVLIGITMFDRPRHLERLVASILAKYPTAKIVVADNGRQRAQLPAPVKVLELPFDCGLSAARNALAAALDRPYLLLLEEDFSFTEQTDIEAFVSVLDDDPTVGMVGGALSVRGVVQKYAVDFETFRGQLLGRPARQPWQVTSAGVPYRYCDKVFNFGLLRAEFLRDHSWDETLKVGEHAPFFHLVKLAARWRIAFTPRVVARHDLDERTEEYCRYRARAGELQRAWFAAQGLPHGYSQSDELHQLTPAASDRPPVVVLGVGHSGTTVITRMLHAAGWNAGDADTEFAESVSIRRLNQTVQRLGAIDPHVAGRALAQLQLPWAIKDPRFVQTLDHWLVALAKYEPLLVWIVRDTAAVVESYRHRGEQAGDTSEKVQQLTTAAQRQYERWPWRKVQLRYEELTAAAKLFELR